MKDNISKHYPNLTGMERFQLALRAAAEGNDEERKRLVRSCPKKTYEMTDAAFLDRIETAEILTLAFSLDLAERHGGLQQIKLFEDFTHYIVKTTWEKALSGMFACYAEGVRQGWQAVGCKGIPDGIDKPDREKIMNELTLQNENQIQTLTKIREELQGQIKAIWEAFSEACLADMGLEPETVLAVFYPPALEWLEDDLSEEVAVNEDMKKKSLDLMREYWQKRISELTR